MIAREGSVRPRHTVCLTAEERRACEEITRDPHSRPLARRRALVLLHADCGRNGRVASDDEVAAHSEVEARTVRRVRATFALKGFTAALHGERGASKSRSVHNGHLETLIASLLAMPPPPTYPRWTVRTLAEELQAMPGGVRVSRETVRLALLRSRGAEGRE
jgi:hypothetical protein